MVKRGLGRGLSSLIPSLVSDQLVYEEIPIGDIGRNENQPRQQFDPEAISELAASITKHGVVQPVIVRHKGGAYELIAGERRWRAAKEAGLTVLPALIKKSDDNQSLQIALVENIQRENLNAIEEATAYKRLAEELGLTQAELADMVGKNRATVANTMRLLNLPEEVSVMVGEGRISSGHARALLALENDDDKLRLALRIDAEGLSVRQTESLVKVWGLSNGGDVRKKEPVPTNIKSLARLLRKALGTKVKAKLARGKIRVEIEFTDEEQLRKLESLLGNTTATAVGQPDT